MRVLVCGGRDYCDRWEIWGRLDQLARQHGEVLVIQGGAYGADQIAREWCEDREQPYVTLEAEWDQFGKSAGPRRNQKMLELEPKLVIAFPGGRGTADMVRRAKAAGIPVQEIN